MLPHWTLDSWSRISRRPPGTCCQWPRPFLSESLGRCLSEHRCQRSSALTWCPSSLKVTLRMEWVHSSPMLALCRRVFLMRCLGLRTSMGNLGLRMHTHVAPTLPCGHSLHTVWRGRSSASGLLSSSGPAAAAGVGPTATWCSDSTDWCQGQKQQWSLLSYAAQDKNMESLAAPVLPQTFAFSGHGPQNSLGLSQERRELRLPAHQPALLHCLRGATLRVRLKWRDT